jgi:hypothetical protein
MMIFHGVEDDSGKENDVGPAKSAESEVFRSQSGGGHQENAEPNSEKPDQADIIGRLPLNDSDNKRDIKKGQDGSGPGADLVKNIHDDSVQTSSFLENFVRFLQH